MPHRQQQHHWYSGESIRSFTGLITALGVIIIAVVNKGAIDTAKDNARNIESSVKSVHTEVKDVHRLANNQQTQLIRTIAVTTRQLAEVTKRPEDLKAAEEAERQYESRLRFDAEEVKADAIAKEALGRSEK